VLSATVASGVMTLSYTTPHGYEDKVWLRLDGAAGGSIVRRATVTGASALTIAAAEFVDGAVAGTLSTRVAPADWEEVFTGTLKAVFRSKVEGPGSTRFFYRVSDAVASSAGSQPRIIRGFESMTDVDAGIGPFPTVAQAADPGVLISRATTSTARAWAVVCDARTVYISLGVSSDTDAQNFWWGDESRFGNADVFCAGITGSASLAQGASRWRPRLAAGTGTAITSGQYSFFGTTVKTYPSPIDGGMVIARPVLTTDANSATDYRSTMRGLMHCSANPVPSGQLWTTMEVSGISGRTLLLRDGGGGLCVAFPLDEDWA